jgi:hypothetical protein
LAHWYTLASFSGACIGPTCSFTMPPADASVTASFTILTSTLTVTVNGTGAGTVSSAPGGINNCSPTGGPRCTATFDYGTPIVLTADPGAGAAVTWSGGCTPTSATTCTIAAITGATAVTATFQATAEAPTFSPPTGTPSPAAVTLSTTTPGATIHFTTDGTTPTAASPAYSAPIVVAATTTINAITVAAGYTDSAVATATYPVP